MEIFEITGYASGQDDSGVNYLSPSDSFQNLTDGYIYRQVLQSRNGFGFFAPRLANGTRITGIFEFIKPDGSRECLATDMNFLYRFNEGTVVFDQIAFGGSMAAYAGFNFGVGIPDNAGYISGTGYPTATNGTRFVFTGKSINTNAAGSAIFFYDGSVVKDFTSVVDNANYAAPVEGALTRATYVFYFNGRINFVVPTIVTQRNQGILYSGIASLTGNGDKFNVAGAGLIQFATQDNILGAGLLGQDMVLQFSECIKDLEITTDAFNPYRLLSIPSALGTNAPFGSVTFANTITSVGKTGILQTDTREAVRIDNKIPNFTADKFDEVNFDLTYGGFDRSKGQFLWLYKSNEGNSTTVTQDRVLVRNYEEDTWAVYNMRFSVLGQTLSGKDLNWNQIDETAGNPSWARWDTTEDLWNKIGLGRRTLKTLAGDNLGFIYELNTDSDDYFTTISAITQASHAVLTVAASGFIAGDKVVVQSVQGMTGINNFDPETNQINIFPEYTVLSSTPTSITLNVDSSLLSAYTSGGTISKVIDFYAETIPLNPYRAQGYKFYISYVEFLLDTIGGSLKVDVYADEQESPFIQDMLISTSATTQDREYIGMTVNQEANFLTFALKQSSPSVQVKLTSMRIHGCPGGLTSW